MSKELENYPNKYTQREWDRTVGWGKVPIKYSKEWNNYEISRAKDDTHGVYLNGLSYPGNSATAGSPSSSHDKKTTVLVGVEYKPWEDSDLEYFAIYQTDNFEDSTSANKAADYSDIVTKIGFRANFGLL